jgi:hypothetical protein
MPNDLATGFDLSSSTKYSNPDHTDHVLSRRLRQRRGRIHDFDVCARNVWLMLLVADFLVNINLVRLLRDSKTRPLYHLA